MGKTKFPKAKSLSLAQQRIGVSSNFPNFRYTGNHKVARWYGSLKAGDLYESYRVKIEYRLQKRPVITVLSPKIQRRDDQPKIPHTYPGDHPCVYFPTTGEWNAEKLIAVTIIPWLAIWLYFYEVWLVTGEWLGGGIDHGEGAKT
jgi:hypothetical protein